MSDPFSLPEEGLEEDPRSVGDPSENEKGFNSTAAKLEDKLFFCSLDRLRGEKDAFEEMPSPRLEI